MGEDGEELVRVFLHSMEGREIKVKEKGWKRQG